MNNLRPLAVALALTALVLTGCHVNTNKDGKHENVDISTPFGGMQVHTNDSTDTAAIGISPYPGAVPFKDENDKDKNSADINMSFGDFHLGVKAATLKSTDSSDKIIAFYRKDLARYGDIITCRGDKTIGEPTHTSQGLTCSDNEKGGTHISATEDGDVELRTGSQQHQHIVGLNPKDGYVKIGLVALELPSHLVKHNDKDIE